MKQVMWTKFGTEAAALSLLFTLALGACGGEATVEDHPEGTDSNNMEMPDGNSDANNTTTTPVITPPMTTPPSENNTTPQPTNNSTNGNNSSTTPTPSNNTTPDPVTGVPNEGWIGGACSSASQCDYDNSICLSDGDGYPGGQCSQVCDRTCPDRDGENSVTFCVGTADGSGQCMSRCDYELFPGQGCRDGYVCRIKSRHTQPDVQVATCVPPTDMDTVMVSQCLQNLTDTGVGWTSWSYTPQHPDGDMSLTCLVEDPIQVDPVINGVTYKYYSQSTGRPMYVGCGLAEALIELGDVLAEYNITEVLHIGTFNCRKISGTSRLSEHASANAIDIWGFVDANGERYVLEEHWEHDTTTFSNNKAQVLYEIGQKMHERKIFHNVLTPNYNAGHDNHFHVDLKPGADFIGVSHGPAYYFGSDEDRWSEACDGHEH